MLTSTYTVILNTMIRLSIGTIGTVPMADEDMLANEAVNLGYDIFSEDPFLVVSLFGKIGQ